MKYVLLMIIIFIIIFINIPIYIRIELKRKKEDDRIGVKIFLLKGLLKLNYDISYIDLFKKNNKIIYKLEGKKTDKDIVKEKSGLKPEDIIEYYHILKKYLDTFSETIQYILDKIILDSFRFYSKIGVGDAALTGIAYGTLWTIIGVFLNVLYSNKEIKNLSITLYPDFNETIIEIDFFCIIKIKIAHIIIAGIKGLKVFIKGGVLNGRSSYTRSNEDNNGKY